MSASFVNTQDKQSGFTLVELLVVIAVIAILSVIGIVIFQGISSKAGSAKRMGDLDAIKKAYETNYGSTGYKTLTGANFASGQIPTPNNTDQTSYFAVGPNAGASTSPAQNYAICASKSGNTNCSIEPTNPDCYCLKSDQGEAVDLLSQGANVIYSESFEGDDTDNNGIFANGWIQTWVGGPHPAGSIVGYSRVNPGFDKSYAQKVTDAQFGEALYSPSITLQPNTRYTYSAYVKLTEVKGTMPGVDIRIALNSGGCGVHGSSRLTQLNQYTRLSVTFNTTNSQCPDNASPTSAIFTIQSVEAGASFANTASFEADAIQIVKEN